jgi:hypothetical protein
MPDSLPLKDTPDLSPDERLKRRLEADHLFHAWYAGAISNSRHYVKFHDFENYLIQYHPTLAACFSVHDMLIDIQNFHRS